MPRDPRPVEMTEALDLHDLLGDLLEHLDGVDPVEASDNNKAAARYKAAKTGELLYAQHLCDKLKAMIGDQYHAFRGTDLSRVTSPE